MSSRAVEFEVAGRWIGPAHAPFVVAEVSANHNGSLERALAIVDAAASAGADAIKLQTYRADTITIDHGGPDFLIEGGPWAGRRLYDLYEEGQMPWEWHAPIFEHARSRGLIAFSSPFDWSAVDLLESLEVPLYKIASHEIVDIPLIQKVAATGKPIIFSTGMASRAEIEDAVVVARNGGARGIVVLHCITGYPTPYEDVNLRTIGDLAERFDVLVGLSDHTMGTAVAVASIALGGVVIEKHVTLKRADGGLDGEFSAEPDELASLVRDVRAAHTSLGEAIDASVKSEESNLRFRRSLYVVRDVAAGEMLTNDNVRSIRPANGLPPKMLSSVVGRRAKRALKRGEPLDWDMVDDAN